MNTATTTTKPAAERPTARVVRLATWAQEGEDGGGILAVLPLSPAFARRLLAARAVLRHWAAGEKAARGVQLACPRLVFARNFTERAGDDFGDWAELGGRHVVLAPTCDPVAAVSDRGVSFGAVRLGRGTRFTTAPLDWAAIETVAALGGTN